MNVDKMNSKNMTPKGKLSKKRIIEAAITSFKVKGYEETTIIDICRSANIAVGTFYHYFSSKQDLLLMMINEMNASMDDFYRKQKISAYSKIILQIVDFYIDLFDFYGPELITNIYRGYILSGKNLFDLNQFAFIHILRDIFTKGRNERQFSSELPVDYMVEMVKSIFFLNSVLWCNHHDTNKFKDALGKIDAFLNLVSLKKVSNNPSL